jgi:hypothetical protein
MPMVTTQVARVDPLEVRTRAGWRTKYLVFGTAPGTCYETWDPWAASLAQRACETHQAVTLGLRELPRWGWGIVTVSL